MKHYGYKVLLFLLRGLVLAKKGIFRFGRLFLPIFSFFGKWYERVIGFRLFKINFSLSRKLQKFKLPKDNRFVDMITSRFLLQCIFLVVILVLAIPQSKLYSVDNALATSHETLLYTLVGPGDQDFDSQDLTISTGALPPVIPQGEENTWNLGALGANGSAQFESESNNEVQDIASISAGGSALLKPSILPGTTLPVQETTSSSGDDRAQVVQYEVQSGDVIGGIATKFGLKIATVLWANNLTARSYIRPGDVLKIPPADGVMYTVKRGDTVGKIARQFGSDQDDIIDFNKMSSDGASISIGDELFIPGAQMYTGSQTSLAIAPSKITETIRKVAAPPPSVDTPAGSGYIWPTVSKRINQYYGLRHTGVDIHGIIGNANYAVKGGTVKTSQCGWNGGYGCYVIVDHGGGITSLYAHNSKLMVAVGDEVDQGDVVGLLGSTGRSTGPHLHFEIRINGKRANPLQYIR